MSCNKQTKRRTRTGRKGLLLFVAILLISGCNDTEINVDALPVRSVSSWSMPANGPSIPAPRGVHCTADGTIYVLDNAGRVVVFNSAGEQLRSWWMPEYDVGRPEGIFRFRDGRVAVADTHYNRVVFFNDEGAVVGMQGEEGREPGQFSYPVAIIQDPEENFYVGEYGGKPRVQKFRVDGTFVCEFGDQGTGPGEFSRPSGLAWHDHRIYAVDAFNNRIQVFSDDGRFLEILGGSDKSPELVYPYDISLADDGQFYVVEYEAGRVTRLDLNGNVTGRFGTIGRSTNQLYTPWGISTGSGGMVYIADTGNRRLLVLQTEAQGN